MHSSLPLAAATRRRASVCGALVALLVVAWPGQAASRLDSDHDGLTDASERVHHCDPARRDTDRDGMTDAFEVRFHLRCADHRDANDDPDRDGVANVKEFRRGTNPHGPLGKPAKRRTVPPLTPIPQTSYKLSDRFNLAIPDSGRRAYDQAQADQEGTTQVVIGDFLSYVEPKQIATVGPGAVRLWTPTTSDCYADKNGARSYFAATNTPTGVRQPCSGDVAADSRT